MSEPALYTGGRRVNVPLPGGGRLGVSVQAGATNQQLLAELRRVQENILRGHSRRVVSIDGVTTLRERTADAWSYVEMWARIAWRATVARSQTRKAIAEMHAALDAALSPSPRSHK